VNDKTRFHEGRLTVSHLMSEQPAVVPLGAPVYRVAEILSSSPYRHVLVSGGDGNVAGVVSSNDILSQMADWSTDDRWKQKPVESVMTTKFITSTPDADAADVAHIITRGDIHCVPVMEGDSLVGVMTSDDLLLSWTRLDPLLKEAATDAVTDLASRAMFNRRLTEEWERAKRSGQALGLVLIDIDGFKAINDECGHLAGDAILCMVGSCLRRNLRIYDIVARYGGDEFAALCCNCRPEDIEVPIKRLQSAIHELSFPSGIQRRTVTLSIGAAIVTGDFDRFKPEMLVEAADRCVYRSKREGRARAYWLTLDPYQPMEQSMRLVGVDQKGSVRQPDGTPIDLGKSGQQPAASAPEEPEPATPSADRQLLDAYARQIGNNMERLSYLQNLATQMTFFDPKLSLDEVAKSILPELRHAIGAQAVALILADRSASTNREGSREVAVWDGPRVMDDNVCISLVEYFRTAAEVRPAVKNRLRHNRSGTMFTDVDSLIVVRIVEQQATVGWLLALQRLPPGESYGPEAGWELNDFEFGTDEAGLVGATATLLALHHRQSQMQKKIEDADTPTISLDDMSDVSSFASVLEPN